MRATAQPLFRLPITCLLAANVACATTPAEPPQQAQLVKAVSPPARLEPPGRLPAEARAMIRTRMASHAQQMSGLMSAIMTLRYPDIEERATTIAEEAHFAGGHGNDATDLNAVLPPAFLDRERDLRIEAHVLADAAHRLDAFAVAGAYGQLSETCVKCHVVYRAGR